MKEIEQAFKNYLKAIYTRDYALMYNCLYEDDMQKFRNKMIEFAHKMDEFGESQDLLKKIGLETLQQIETLSTYDFMTSIFRFISREIGKDKLNKILSETKITSVDSDEYYTSVAYEYPLFMFDEWEIYSGEVKMVKVGDKWKILFKSGLEATLSRFQEDIDRYFDRKSRDNISNLGFEGDLTTFTLRGYKDFATGKVVIEPRFRDAGDFAEGLAYVKVFSKYGYINVKGEMEIKPQFSDARDFYQNLAAVKTETSEEKSLWGFINKKGKLVIPFQFDSIQQFNEGLCAVRKDDKWGYIDKKGNLVIPYQYDDTRIFSKGLCAVQKDEKWGYIDTKGNLVIPHEYDSATDFDRGKAFVEKYNEEGDIEEFTIDKKGNIKRVE